MRHSIEEFNADADAGAAIAGIALGLGNTIFSFLANGERFRFKTGPVYRKLRAGTYSDDMGRTWKTGQRTAVFRA